MTSPSTERARLQSTLTTLQTYLTEAGWDEVSTDERGTVWHRRAADRDLTIALPSTVERRDVERDLAEAIATLAFAERRSSRELTSDLHSGGADTVSVRLVPETPSGTAPLSLAQDAIAALRQLVVASASALLNKALVLPNRRPPQAETYAANTRLATSPGSFVLDLTLPLGRDELTDEPDALVPILEPFGRRVATRMQRTAERALRKASEVTTADAKSLADFANPSLGLGNATELDALAKLGGDRMPYQLRFTHSALASERRPPRLLTASRADQEILRTAAEYLRNSQPRENATIEGIVVRLFRERVTGPREVTLSAILDDSGVERRCRVSLFEADYALALAAHQQGFRVRVTGDLTAGTPRRIQAVSSFTLVDDALTDA